MDFGTQNNSTSVLICPKMAYLTLYINNKLILPKLVKSYKIVYTQILVVKLCG